MSRRQQAVVLGLVTFACLVMLPVGAVGAIASPMVFEDPYNLERPIAWIAFFLMLSLWIICIAAPFGAWVAFYKRSQGLQWVAAGAPFAWFAALAACMTFARV
jgi:hypothetical protein